MERARLIAFCDSFTKYSGDMTSVCCYCELDLAGKLELVDPLAVISTLIWNTFVSSAYRLRLLMMGMMPISINEIHELIFLHLGLKGSLFISAFAFPMLTLSVMPRC
jgi:hypothetical protein